ncbi:MAG: hypothetical protein ACO3C0_12890, partial [Burkholderiaceae bacterium]
MNPDLALKHPPVVASMASQRSWLVMLLAASAGGLIAYVGVTGLGGLAVAIPRAGSSLEPRQAIWTVAGGPLSSASVALVTLIMYPYLSGLESVFLFQVGLMSLAIGVATLIPLQTGGFASDGGQLWQL